MDYCDGGDLYARIAAQKGALFNEEVVFIIIIDFFKLIFFIK